MLLDLPAHTGFGPDRLSDGRCLKVLELEHLPSLKAANPRPAGGAICPAAEPPRLTKASEQGRHPLGGFQLRLSRLSYSNCQRPMGSKQRSNGPIRRQEIQLRDDKSAE